MNTHIEIYSHKLSPSHFNTTQNCCDSEYLLVSDISWAFLYHSWALWCGINLNVFYLGYFCRRCKLYTNQTYLEPRRIYRWLDFLSSISSRFVLWNYRCPYSQIWQFETSFPHKLSNINFFRQNMCSCL